MATRPALSLERLSLHACRVSDRTVWLFCEATDADGRHGYGEATCGNEERAVGQFFSQAAKCAVDGQAVGEREPQTIAEAAAYSGIDQAVTDLAARRAGVSLSEAIGLGPAGASPVSLYANINRGTAVRTAEGFAKRALQAASDGFRAVKIAPFDRMPPAQLTPAGTGMQAASLDEAVARIRSVCTSVGPDVEVLVDCHWALDEDGAVALADAVAPLGIRHLECPLPETENMVAAAARLRKRYHGMSMSLAGGEMIFRSDQLETAIAGETMDIVMPDIKYVRSLAEYYRFVNRIAAAGLEPSPHNPSGPIAHAVSWQLSSSIDSIRRLELQYSETPLFPALIGRAQRYDQAFWNDEMPRGPGIGVDLDHDAVDETRVGRITVDAAGMSAAGLFAGLD